MVQPDRAQMTVWSMWTEFWIRKNTNTQSEYVILIAFLQQQWSQERASTFRYTSIAYLFSITKLPFLSLSLGPYYCINSTTFALFRAYKWRQPLSTPWKIKQRGLAPLFLNVVSGWTSLCNLSFTAGWRVPKFLFKMKMGGYRASLGVSVKRQFYCCCRNSNQGSTCIQTVT